MQLDAAPVCRHTAGPGGDPLVWILRRHGVRHAHLLGCADVHEMVRVLARANYAARADRALFEALDCPPPPPRFERRSLVVAASFGVLTLLAFVFACGFFGKILTW